MSVQLDLGSLRLSCPSIGLDLALTSSASISTLLHSCSLNTPSVANIESGRLWVAPAANVKLHVIVTWPSSLSKQRVIKLNQYLVTALQHAAVSSILLAPRLWTQLNFQPSLTVKPSQCPNTCFLVVSLTATTLSLTGKKAPTHRLGKDVPISHLKPPEGLPHWTLDELHLGLRISSSMRCPTLKNDSMLFEDSTPLEHQADMSSNPTAELTGLEQCIDLIDAALRLALSDLPSKALSGLKITKRSSFKHLDDICPAMWNPGHLEALASRAVFLPAISHALSNSVSQRAQSISLREKLKEISRQESVVTSENQEIEPQVIQKAVNIRLWRLMQRRLRDPTAGKKLKSIRIADPALPSSELDEDADNILSFEHEGEQHIHYPSEDFLELDEEGDEEENLLDVEYGSKWEDLFTSVELEDCLFDHDMLDDLHDQQPDGYTRITDTCVEDDMSSNSEDMLELLRYQCLKQSWIQLIAFGPPSSQVVSHLAFGPIL
ncbi:hypothetical protein QM012_004496 [Aureobasidium pullulans]|uniref:Uncharacterized protein n=1 Tax=Aureobasidium pullulans TaxID=5580 RepID=A0ABR0TTE3_AURPU